MPYSLQIEGTDAAYSEPVFNGSFQSYLQWTRKDVADYNLVSDGFRRKLCSVDLVLAVDACVISSRLS